MPQADDNPSVIRGGLAPYMRISRRYVHERLKLPEAVNDDDVFRAEQTPAPEEEQGSDGEGEDARPPAEREDARARQPLASSRALRMATAVPLTDCHGNQSLSPSVASSVATAGAMAAAQPADDAQATLDRIDADAALAAAGESLLRPILDELADGLAPDELQARLADLYPQMDDSQLAEILARAMFVAEIWGRVSRDA